ncbi:MAG: hypothetical protein JNL02_09290 [Saprospiraceae bacterium]|nr:hypothetical protein [Saprospiraceae bacterium]
MLPPNHDCDTILMLNGNVRIARIEKMTATEVTYRLCDQHQSKQLLRLPMSDVAEIRWHQPAAGKRRAYQAWVHLYDADYPMTGFFLTTTDTSVWLSHSENPLAMDKAWEIPVGRIRKIKISRVGRLGEKVLTGAAIGMGIGTLAGYASGDDPPGFLSFTKEEKSVMGLIFMGLGGAIIGLFVGLKKNIVILDGQQEKYRQARPLLTRFTLTRK